MEELIRMIELEKEIVKQEKDIECVTQDKKVELKKLQDEIQELEKPFRDVIKIDKEIIAGIRSDILNNWNPDWGKQFVDEDTGITLTRKTREKPDIIDEKALLTQAVTFDKLPISKISWINKDLKALINAGVVKPEVARIQENYELAISHPKE